MSFVLSVVQPARGRAGRGTAAVSDPEPDRDALRTAAYQAVQEAAPWAQPDQLSRYAEQIVGREDGVWSVDSSTGLRFRIDKAESAPRVCPCCYGLVLPDDYPYAKPRDSHCRGCVAFGRDTPKCLPMNTAHQPKEDVDV